MNLKNLEYVVEIVRCGSINQAAQNLYLSQPNLSSSIKNLEAELRFSIFKRRRSGVELTPEGAVLVQSAKKILIEMGKIRLIPSLFESNTNLSVSCTYSYPFMRSFMAFRKTSPADVQDTFKETGLIQTLQDVMEQSYRMSLFYCFGNRVSRHKAFAEEYDLTLELLAEQIPVTVLAARDGPLGKRDYIDVTEIPTHNFATYENFAFSDWLEVLGFTDEHKVLYVFDRGGLLDTVEQSDCISVVMKSELERANCVELPIRGLEVGLSVFLLHHRAYTPNPRERQFVQMLKRDLGKTCTGTLLGTANA